MIDKFIYKCCDVLDRYSEWMNSIFIPKPKKKLKIPKYLIDDKIILPLPKPIE